MCSWIRQSLQKGQAWWAYLYLVISCFSHSLWSHVGPCHDLEQTQLQKPKLPKDILTASSASQRGVKVYDVDKCMALFACNLLRVALLCDFKAAPQFPRQVPQHTSELWPELHEWRKNCTIAQKSHFCTEMFLPPCVHSTAFPAFTQPLTHVSSETSPPPTPSGHPLTPLSFSRPTLGIYISVSFVSASVRWMQGTLELPQKWTPETAFELDLTFWTALFPDTQSAFHASRVNLDGDPLLDLDSR